MIFNKPVRRFTLLLRRFKALYWDENDCLRFTTWWQWGARHFRIRSKLILRSYFSDWEELQDRVASEDLDACLIRQCISAINLKKDPTVSAESTYNNMVTVTRDKYQV